MHGTGTTTMSMVQQDPTIVTTMVRLTMSIVMITVQQTGITTMTTALPIGTLRTIMVLPTGITTTTTVQQTGTMTMIMVQLIGTTTMTTVLPIGHMKSLHMTGGTKRILSRQRRQRQILCVTSRSQILQSIVVMLSLFHGVVQTPIV